MNHLENYKYAELIINYIDYKSKFNTKSWSENCSIYFNEAILYLINNNVLNELYDYENLFMIVLKKLN